MRFFIFGCIAAKRTWLEFGIAPHFLVKYKCTFDSEAFNLPPIQYLMSSVLQLLLEGERLETSQMAEILGLKEAEVESELTRLQDERILLGWRPVFNPAEVEDDQVRAVIEVKISPEREGGFDRLSLRISRFDEVESCYLMSGGYDLLVIVAGKNLRSVATFVSERLASIEGVLSTSTHFLLRAYKEQRHLLVDESSAVDQPAVSP